MSAILVASTPRLTITRHAADRIASAVGRAGAPGVVAPFISKPAPF
jgi:hypothetical protein